MKNYLIPTSVIFQVLSLVHVILRDSLAGVIIFALASAILAFFIHTGEKHTEESKTLHARVAALEGNVGQITIALKNW